MSDIKKEGSINEEEIKNEEGLGADNDEIVIQDIRYTDGPANGADEEYTTSSKPVSDIEFISDEDVAGKEESEKDKAPSDTESQGLDTAGPDEEEEELEFISEDTVKDKSHMAEGEAISDERVSEKKTKRRGIDETDAKREKVIFAAKNNKVLLIAAVVIIIIVIIAIAAGVKRSRAKKAEENLAQPISEQEYETDEYANINELIENYYACWAEGDTDSILLYAYPMSDMEMSYIQMYSEYLEGMENVVCYTKTGVNDGEYVVSVTAEWKYEGVDTTAPGLDFFYVVTDENGDVYIDNVYSTFNMVYQEYEMEDAVLELIDSYQTGDDVIALQASVQTLYDSALEADETLRVMLEETLPAAIAAWSDSYGSESTEDASSEDTSSEESAEDTSSEDTSSEESTEDTSSEESTEDTSASDEITETESKAWMNATEGVYIRESPSTDSEALASLNAGDEVRQLAVTSNGWSKVKSGDIVGYVKSEYLTAQ